MSGIGKTWAQARAGSASYPNQVIKFVAPFPPDGTVDILTRAVSSQLAREVGQQVMVDNRGGADGAIGADAVARSSPDAYTCTGTELWIPFAPPANPSPAFGRER
jgi:tripartite-type tricarboxylate transporter receptor subunit TctC